MLQSISSNLDVKQLRNGNGLSTQLAICRITINLLWAFLLVSNKVMLQRYKTDLNEKQNGASVAMYILKRLENTADFRNLRNTSISAKFRKNNHILLQ